MKIECPICDYSCPYCKLGYCQMEGADPLEECDAFFGMEDDC